jgi:ABC-2 type transport system ATP-binding protein
MIETHKLSKVFAPKTAVAELDLRVEPGEILGFLGPNGAGKTTTVKMLTGMLRPTSGSARVAGYDVVEQPLEVKKRLGYVPESGALYETLTADEYLEMIAALHHMDPASAAARIGDLLDVFDLLSDRDKRLSEFSKGMKQKVLIVAALLDNPEVLFLDEPLNGIDANSAMTVKELLRKLAAQGKTILFSSHILEVVERICTRIVIIHQGRQIIDGSAEEITRQTGTSTLEEAFARLTGGRDAGDTSAELLAALERV